MLYVYHSELTHSTMITCTNHGTIWERDEEVYDLVHTCDGQHDVEIDHDYNIFVV